MSYGTIKIYGDLPFEYQENSQTYQWRRIDERRGLVVWVLGARGSSVCMVCFDSLRNAVEIDEELQANPQCGRIEKFCFLFQEEWGAEFFVKKLLQRVDQDPSIWFPDLSLHT